MEKPKRILTLLAILWVINLFFFLKGIWAGECGIPPFVGSGIKSNVIIMLDNSGSMKHCMYDDTDFSGWKCSQGTHDDFDPTVTYYGIFDSDKKYRYDSTIPVDPTPWQSGPYYITVDTSKTGAFVEADCSCGNGNNCWDGNFLNWLTTRRIDAARKALVGGKVENRNGYDYISGDGGDLEWKILGNNEPWDHDFCKRYAHSSQYSPYTDNTQFRIYSPADDGNAKSSYDPYAKIEISGTAQGQVGISDINGNKIGEAGVIDIKHNWKTVHFSKSYSDPIVVVGPLSYNGGDPSVPRVKAIKNSSFQVRVQEWVYKDGKHTIEYLYYMVVEKGVHTLPGGIRLVADKITVNKVLDRYNCGNNCCSGYVSSNWQTVSYGVTLNSPIVKSTIVHPVTESCTYPLDGNSACHTVVTRIKDVTKTQFKIALEEEERLGSHGSELVHYIAVEKGTVDFGNGTKMEVGSTGNSVTNSWKTINFSSLTKASIFLADMQTTNGADTATLRYQKLSSSSVQVFVEEEKSCDPETSHVSENVGYIAFETGVGNRYNIALIVEEEPTGIVQDVSDKVRIGVSFYRYNKNSSNIYTNETADGGTLRFNIPKNPFVKKPSSYGGYRILETHVKANIDDIVDAIEHYPLVWGTTPLAENYYELMRYFRQQSPYYNSNDYSVNSDWDPYYYSDLGGKQRCANSFIVVFTDGEPWRDCNVPSISGCANSGGTSCSNTGPDCDGDGDEPKREIQGSTCYITDYLDDLSYWAHNHDLRDDIDGDQIITTYSVIFGITELCGQFTDYTSCENAGCDWMDDECWPGTKNEKCRKALMKDTAENGGGEFYYAADGEQLAKAFTSIMESIIRSGAAGAVATVTQDVRGEDIVIRGAFETYLPGDPNTYIWRGHLEAYWPFGPGDMSNESECENAGWVWEDGQCKGTGVKYDFEVYDATFCKDMPNPKHCWDAGQRLQTHTDRTIFTYINNSKVYFNASNATTLDPYLENDIDFNNDSSIDIQDTKALINWVRGDTTYDGSTAYNRSGWILRDIVYSTPVVVGTPSIASIPKSAVGDCSCDCINNLDSCAKQCFYCFRYKYRHRKKVVYVGANDGMLHAFLAGYWFEDPDPTTDNDGDGIANESHWIYNPNETNSKCDGYNCTDEDGYDLRDSIGKELWAYIPSNLLSELKELARSTYGERGSSCEHKYMVDLSPEAWDVFIRVDTDHDGNLSDETPQWRTILIGGERDGGDVYFALDVTDPDDPQVLWEYSVFRNMIQVHEGGLPNTFNQSNPYLDKSIYDQVKGLSVTWSQPYIGRLNIPDSVCFYAARPIAPLESGSPSSSVNCLDKNDLSEWFAFIGGGIRVFDLSELPATLSDDEKRATIKPFFMILDVETGTNIFQYLWPLLRPLAESNWIDKTVGGNYIPYAMSDPLVLDIWDENGDIDKDGYMDHIYVGDLNGQFYGIKFHMGSGFSKYGIKIDIWKTKDGLDSNNYYRSEYQPISVTPVAAFDPENNLHIYFGTGKYDNVTANGNDDKTDLEKMSFYNLKDNGHVKALTSTPCSVAKAGSTFTFACTNDAFLIPNTDFTVEIEFHCESSTYNSSCTWTRKEEGEDVPDCCEATCCTNITSSSSCTSPCTWSSGECTGNCWYCIYDLTKDGERVTDSALVAGELVFFPTFVPQSDPCKSLGDSYLYVLDYLCRPLSSNPFENTELSYEELKTEENKVIGYRVHLNAENPGQGGIPSRPVLDSSGEHVLVQDSTAKIHRIKVELPKNPFYLKGWKEEGS